MQLRLTIILSLFISAFSSCNNSGNSHATFCDTACLKDSLKFIKSEHPLKPYVYISTKDCMADSVIWSYTGMGINRKTGLRYRLNKDYVRCFIRDTSYAWLLFNSCDNGRGYFLKLPFNKKTNFIKSTGAINNFDPKFSVADGLVAYTDKGNIFTEDMATGKKAMMTFGKQADFDFDAIHETLDSVNITPSRIWVKVKIDNEWKELEKNITLQ